jgi:hypothetical protein
VADWNPTAFSNCRAIESSWFSRVLDKRSQDSASFTQAARSASVLALVAILEHSSAARLYFSDLLMARFPTPRQNAKSVELVPIQPLVGVHSGVQFYLPQQ